MSKASITSINDLSEASGDEDTVSGTPEHITPTWQKFDMEALKLPPRVFGAAAQAGSPRAVSPTLDMDTQYVSILILGSSQSVSPSVDINIQYVSILIPGSSQSVPPTVDIDTQYVSILIPGSSQSVSPTLDMDTQYVSILIPGLSQTSQ